VGVMKSVPVLAPPIDLQHRFASIVAPASELARTFRAANDRLAASRDLLLPRLISGQLSVASAERYLEEAA
jgi:type I restriction enzyme S subunit